jgi:hypothetical protein
MLPMPKAYHSHDYAIANRGYAGCSPCIKANLLPQIAWLIPNSG